MSALGFSQTTLYGPVKIDSPPPTVSVDTTAIKILARRVSDKRVVQPSWAQLKAYFGGGGSVPNWQSVMNAGSTATVSTDIEITHGAGADFSNLSLTDGFAALSAGDNTFSLNDTSAQIDSPIFVGAPTEGGHAARLSDVEAATTGVFVPYSGADSDVNLGDYAIKSFGYYTPFDQIVIDEGGKVTSYDEFNIFNTTSEVSAIFTTADLTTGRTLNIPDADGTIALLSDVTGIPLSGTEVGSPVTGDIESEANITAYLYKVNDGAVTNLISDETGTLRTNQSLQLSNSGLAGGQHILNTPISNTTTYQWTLPEEDGTIALLSDITGGGGTVTSVTGVSGETTVANGTTEPVIGIASAYTAARDAYADGKVADNLTASTTVAPSKTAVNTALALKANLASPTFTGTVTAPTLTNPGAMTIGTTTSTAINFQTNGATRMQITSSGAFQPAVNNAQSAGTSGNRFSNMFSVLGDYSSTLTAASFKVSALNTAPSSSTDTGTTGEIRITATYIYVCTGANTWVRSPLTTF